MKTLTSKSFEDERTKCFAKEKLYEVSAQTLEQKPNN